MHPRALIGKRSMRLDWLYRYDEVDVNGDDDIRWKNVNHGAIRRYLSPCGWCVDRARMQRLNEMVAVFALIQHAQIEI